MNLKFYDKKTMMRIAKANGFDDYRDMIDSYHGYIWLSMLLKTRDKLLNHVKKNKKGRFK